MGDMNRTEFLSYFLRYGFLDRKERDIENAVFITKLLLKSQGVPFKYEDFENNGIGGVVSREIRKILIFGYGRNSREEMLALTKHVNGNEKLKRYATLLGKFDSGKLSFMAQYLLDTKIGGDGSTHMYPWEAKIAENTLAAIECDLYEEPLKPEIQVIA